MRYYLNFPLVAGYVLMATTACLGVLQIAAARGDYAGLALFSTKRTVGFRIGATMVLCALSMYVAFAPEILTPGPAGTEVAELFAVCALTALLITVIGADHRLRARKTTVINALEDAVEKVRLSESTATLYRPRETTAEPDLIAQSVAAVPALVIIPDPLGWVVLPARFVQELRNLGFAVLVLDPPEATSHTRPPFSTTLLRQVTAFKLLLAQFPWIDGQRLGLIGLGLSGDALVQTVSSFNSFDVMVSVSGVEMGCLGGGSDFFCCGLQWLHELSYLQIWRGRRRWKTLRFPVTQENQRNSAISPPLQGSIAVAVPAPSGTDMNTQSRLPRFEMLPVPGCGPFRILESKKARHSLVKWIQQQFQSVRTETNT
jgi:hypothetical protein